MQEMPAARAAGRIRAGVSRPGGPTHRITVSALYLRDPDETGVELYWDRPQEMWPRTPQGELSIFTRRLDLNALLNEIEAV